MQNSSDKSGLGAFKDDYNLCRNFKIKFVEFIYKI